LAADVACGRGDDDHAGILLGLCSRGAISLPRRAPSPVVLCGELIRAEAFVGEGGARPRARGATHLSTLTVCAGGVGQMRRHRYGSQGLTAGPTTTS
jgi:hypothetical protein